MPHFTRTEGKIDWKIGTAFSLSPPFRFLSLSQLPDLFPSPVKTQKMAFLLNRTSLSQFRLQPQKDGSFNDSLELSRRGLHVEPGSREKALLADDPALKHFKSHKKGVKRLKRVGDALTIIVVAGCCYEIYVKAVMREEARKQGRESA